MSLQKPEAQWVLKLSPKVRTDDESIYQIVNIYQDVLDSYWREIKPKISILLQEEREQAYDKGYTACFNKKMQPIIEKIHCDEQNCPECNTKAYNKGRQSLLKELEGEIGGTIKHSIDELIEMNKHLDSRSFQSSLDKSAGMIEHNQTILSILKGKGLKE